MAKLMIFRTVLESAPKVGSVNLNLHKLYERVCEEGGYDKVSDTRGNKLAWRRIAIDFLPHNANIITLAFQVKTAYYKNLAAYEISTFHKQDPPPKEILEDLTAKGGDLLNRNLENYQRRARKEVEDLNGNESASDEDRMDLDDTPNARITRAGLRQAPPQRVLFGQSDSAFRGRGSQHSPTPGNPVQHINGYGSNQTVSTLANYEPRQISALNVKAVTTPSNNPQYFKELAKRQKDSFRRNKGLTLVKGMMLPGTGYPGPNIYMRCLFALQSGVPSEVRYALHHLVKISHERGDKFRFDQFVNLADNLLQIMCSATSIWYDHPGWNYSWEDSQTDDDWLTLNQLHGTSNLLEKIAHFPLITVDTLRTADWITKMGDVTSAALVIRNMIILDDNANFVCAMPLVRDTITIILQLPKAPETVEVKYYALEIAEQLTRFWVLDENDALYHSLIQVIEENLYDRGIIITGLRALSRISMDLDVTNRLRNIPSLLLSHVYQWLLVEDEDLRGACLDLLYQYTAVTENVQSMVESVDTEALIDVLMQFLVLGAVRINLNQETQQKALAAPSTTGIAENLPKLAPSIVEKLCQIADSKEQSSAWYAHSSN
jgi:chromatin structure-remodeling complex subunit RSC9